MSNDTKHTKEPWSIIKSGQQIEVLDSDGAVIIRWREHSGNIFKIGSRIVACVNACAGLDTYSVELAAKSGIAGMGGLTMSIASMSNKLTTAQQRIDDLQRELREAQGSFEASLSRLADENEELQRWNAELNYSLTESLKDSYNALDKHKQEDMSFNDYMATVIAHDKRDYAKLTDKALAAGEKV